MRIIAGKYKHRRFDVPHTFKARPTTDFAKEGLFNILQNTYIDFTTAPRALDLFCGTGSISLELLSRGCGKVVSIEKDYQHYQFISKVCRTLGDKNWIPLHADVFKYLSKKQQINLTAQNNGEYDIIFADPPYALTDFDTIPEKVLEVNLLSPDGLFILEHSKTYDFSNNPHFIDHRTYGSVNFTFFKA
ncbi:MAG: 16S rRNA (guanine(966)-N(2))-methyltransferase RsmD [Prevotellaceae bacterium]|nr:16S rRNA (guanine(966)-N(2))-methyltransferase RsmD [Candidatus Colivivens equi]MCQ2075782.1 16S rRNA (guanine(966)-N(2))-methyltransferase RsmD [Bacteroidaceae bacterium]